MTTFPSALPREVLSLYTDLTFLWKLGFCFFKWKVLWNNSLPALIDFYTMQSEMETFPSSKNYKAVSPGKGKPPRAANSIQE